VRKQELRLMFWNAVIKTVNVTMVFGVPPIVTFAVLVRRRQARPCLAAGVCRMRLWGEVPAWLAG
jgi:hypothetical protein